MMRDKWKRSMVVSAIGRTGDGGGGGGWAGEGGGVGGNSQGKWMSTEINISIFCYFIIRKIMFFMRNLWMENLNGGVEFLIIFCFVFLSCLASCLFFPMKYRGRLVLFYLDVWKPRGFQWFLVVLEKESKFMDNLMKVEWDLIVYRKHYWEKHHQSSVQDVTLIARANIICL